MHTINDLKIDKLVNRNIFTMSGGEKQALAFASIYTVNPEIYVLDEPTANLDQKSIQILKKTTRKNQKSWQNNRHCRSSSLLSCRYN